MQNLTQIQLHVGIQHAQDKLKFQGVHTGRGTPFGVQVNHYVFAISLGLALVGGLPTHVNDFILAHHADAHHKQKVIGTPKRDLRGAVGTVIPDDLAIALPFDVVPGQGAPAGLDAS